MKHFHLVLNGEMSDLFEHFATEEKLEYEVTGEGDEGEIITKRFLISTPNEPHEVIAAFAYFVGEQIRIWEPDLVDEEEFQAYGEEKEEYRKEREAYRLSRKRLHKSLDDKDWLFCATVDDLLDETREPNRGWNRDFEARTGIPLRKFIGVWFSVIDNVVYWATPEQAQRLEAN